MLKSQDVKLESIDQAQSRCLSRIPARAIASVVSWSFVITFTPSSIVGLGIQFFGQAFREHRAWFSVDSLSIDETATEEERTAQYRQLARLFAEFLDENCLLIYN